MVDEELITLQKQLSEIDAAFAAPGDLITRGLHFHKEALRLWNVEAGKPSLTNLQALLVLSLEYVCVL